MIDADLPLALLPRQTDAMDQKLVGIHEIAAALGVTRQRADQLSRREDFPKPVVDLQMGRIWNTKDIRKWMKSKGR